VKIAGTPRAVIEPYRTGDRVEVWTPSGWQAGQVTHVARKSVHVLFGDGRIEPVSKRRARRVA
jgi:hypothetical protein